MPILMLTKNSTDVDGAVKALVMNFLSKLSQDDSLPGLHIEPILNSVDPRVRTGRVNDFYRAVLFKLQGSGEDATYVVDSVRPHDDAIKRAKVALLKLNPYNGIPEVIEQTQPEVAAAAPVPVPEAQIIAQPAPEPEIIATPEPPRFLPSLGYELSDLIERLGLDAHVADLAIGVRTEDEILDLAGEAIQWQGLALLDLAAGKSIDDIRDSLSIADLSKPDSSLDNTDDELLQAMQHPAAQSEFALIQDDEALRQAIEGDFAAWRTFLHPEQRRYATTDYNGPFRLSGGAGTGKTVVLIHRARELHRKDPNARILLTTYTKTLAEALRSDLKTLDPTVVIAADIGDPGIHVAGIDAGVNRVLKAAEPLARGIAVEKILGPRNGELTGRTQTSNAWLDVGASAGGELEPALRGPAFLSAEYTMVVIPHRITTRDAYFKVRRPGRGIALDRGRRAAVWSVIEAYRSWTAIDGSIDFAEAASIAAAILEDSSPLFDHVLVDEGQDLTPSHWQFLRAIVTAGPNDLFIAEDSHQRIYGQRVVLGRLGIAIVGRSRRLTLNYRTTAQNLRYAVQMLAGENFVDVEGEPEESSKYRSSRRGPNPQTIATYSVGDELDKAAEIVDGWIDAGRAPEAIGVLVRDKQQMSRVVHGLAERGLAARQVDSRAAGAGMPLVMTMHRAKGMEFECVLIFGASDGELPLTYLMKDMAEADKLDFLQRERSLLYVSATRARDELVIIWAGEPSEMLPISL